MGSVPRDKLGTASGMNTDHCPDRRRDGRRPFRDLFTYGLAAAA